MAIFIYQIFIVATLIVLRIFGGKALLGGAMVWSCLTLVNVFFPPLIAVQLAVVWITYAVIAPRRETTVDTKGHAKASAPPSSRSTPRPPAEPLRPASLAKTLSKSASPGPWDAAKGIVKNLVLDSEVSGPLLKQRAMIELQEAFIEFFMGRATAQLAHKYFLDEADAETKAIYYKERAKRAEAFNASLGKKPEFRYNDFSFAIPEPPEYLDPTISKSLKSSWDKLISARFLLLSGTIRKLENNEELKSEFLRIVSEHGADKLILLLNNKSLSRLGALNFTKNSKPDAIFKPKAMVPSAETAPEALDAVATFALDAPQPEPFPPDALAIRQIAERKNVPYLVHFTSINNLESILTHGLRSSNDAQAQGLNPTVNDVLRLDRRRHATSTSIAFPNASMFWKYRQENQGSKWVVLLLDPSILWKHECYFCRHNAADARISRLPAEDILKPQAFDAMFDELEGYKTREAQNLRSFDPTDPQAEVMVLGVIPPEAITTIVFNDPASAASYSARVQGRTIEVHAQNSGFFGQRAFARTGRGVI